MLVGCKQFCRVVFFLFIQYWFMLAVVWVLGLLVACFSLLHVCAVVAYAVIVARLCLYHEYSVVYTFVIFARLCFLFYHACAIQLVGFDILLAECL